MYFVMGFILFLVSAPFLFKILEREARDKDDFFELAGVSLFFGFLVMVLAWPAAFPIFIVLLLFKAVYEKRHPS